MAESPLRDLFSAQAAEYARFRPHYPEELIQALLHLSPRKDSAWDCACGNGQVALALAPYFGKIEATDISRQQLGQAPAASNVQYSLASAEHTSFPDQSFDLITVAQAAHWFDLPAFYREVARLIRPGGILAIWGYSLLRIRPDLDALIDHFYTQVTGPYWDPARRLIDHEYRDLYFPFEALDMPDFAIEKAFTPASLAGYLSSWSAVQQLKAQTGLDPIPEIQARLEAIWGDEPELNGQIPIFMKVARF